MPKFNLYQSLHTTVVGPAGQAARGADPHPGDAPAGRVRRRRALGATRSDAPADDIAWLQPHRRLAAGDQRPGRVHGEPEDRPRAGRGLRLHAEGRGRSRCPSGATPVDFAYAIHTEVGHRCIGARVNGRLVPLDHDAASRATRARSSRRKVEGAGPVAGLAAVRRSRRGPATRSASGSRRERRDDAIETGREELDQGAAPRGPAGAEARRLATLLADGRRRAELRRPRRAATPRSARTTCRPSRSPSASPRGFRGGDEEEQLPATVAAPAPARADGRADVGVHVEGLDDVMVRLSRCCTPVPGDEIIGFVTRGRGVSVHRADCANAGVADDRPGRPAHRGRVGRRRRAASSWRRSRSRRSTGPGCCATSPTRSSEHHVNIVACTTQTGTDRVAKMRFEFELADPGHLDAVLAHDQAASTASTTPTASCPARAAERANRAARVPRPSGTSSYGR